MISTLVLFVILRSPPASEGVLESPPRVIRAEADSAASGSNGSNDEDQYKAGVTNAPPPSDSTDAKELPPSLSGAVSVPSAAKKAASNKANLGNATPPSLTDKEKRNDGISAASTLEVLLSAMVLGFGVIVLLLQFRLLQRRQANPKAPALSPMDVMRVFTISMVVMGTLFAITAGFSSEQIAPAMGLFGTLAGYLLGRRDQKIPPANDEK